MLLVHAAASFMLQGYRLSAHARHLLWHSHRQLWAFSNTVRFQHSLCPQTLDLTQDLHGSLDPRNTASDSWPWNRIHSSGCLPGSCVLISSSRMRSCQYNNHRERKPFLPPTSRINAAHLHTEPALVRQQLKPRPSGGWVGTHEPQIYKLDFYPFTSRSLPSTRQLRRRRQVGQHACCNYNHIHKSCITRDSKGLSGYTCHPVTNEWAAK